MCGILGFYLSKAKLDFPWDKLNLGLFTIILGDRFKLEQGNR
jgi:hypothetical protein